MVESNKDRDENLIVPEAHSQVNLTLQQENDGEDDRCKSVKLFNNPYKSIKRFNTASTYIYM